MAWKATVAVVALVSVGGGVSMTVVGCGAHPRVGVGLLVEGLTGGVDGGDGDLVPVHRHLEVVEDLCERLRGGHPGPAGGTLVAGRAPAEGVDRRRRR